jgi:hypothetical protein
MANLSNKLPTLTLEQCDLVKWLTVKEATEYYGWKDTRTTIKKCKDKKLLFIKIGNEYRIPILKEDYQKFMQKKSGDGNVAEDSAK